MPRLGQALAAAAVAALLAVPGAAATPGPPPPTFSPNRVIVEWAAAASSVERQAARAEADVVFADDLGNRRFQLVETELGQAPGAAIRALEANPAVSLAERDGHFHLDAVPDDPLFPRLWGLRNTGLSGNGVMGADIDALGAWERTLGTPSTIVAVLDSGYRFEHPDLDDVVWTNPGETLNGADDDGNGIVDDLHGADFIGSDGEAPAVDGDPTDDDLLSGGHGIHTAGIVGAEGSNGIGVVGVAQGVTVMPLRVCTRFDGGLDCLHSAAIAAINYAGAQGARVANMSFGSTTDTAAIENAIAANPQTLFVASAGNETSSNDPRSRRPCTVNPVAEGKGAVDNVICVAATDQADALAPFSNWGAKTVDLGAPGAQILSASIREGFVSDSFQADDFALRWSAGPGGGFGRTDETPLTSFGISDSPGAAAVAGSTRTATTVPVTLPPGSTKCALEFDRFTSLGGGTFWFEVLLNGALELDSQVEGDGHYATFFGEALSAGGQLQVRLAYAAGPDPSAGDGVWVDNVELTCRAGRGEADGYALLQGTSMAAPHVAGAAALAFSLKPSASVAEVRRALLETVDKVPSLAGKTVTGGRLDAAAALDLFDAVPPPVPALKSTNPLSPSSNSQPRLLGTAQPGTSIDVYANPTCSGSPVANGSAAQLAAPGIAISVGDDTTTQFSVRATDLAPLASACSAPISYTHVKPMPPDPGDGDGGQDPNPGGGGSGGNPTTPPVGGGGDRNPSPTCTVPTLAGKSLAQAKAALTAAACRLGTVRKPRPRPGKRLPPLVVRSSTPGAGAKPAAAKVGLTLGPKPKKARR